MTGYTVRKSVLEKDTTYTLLAEGVEITTENKPPRTIRFADLTTVNLAYVPTRFDKRYFCTLKYKGSKVDIVSTTYDGPGSFTEQSHDYRTFVLALHERLAESAPQAKYKGGGSVASYGCMVVLMIALVPIALFAIYYWFTNGGAGPAAIKAVLVLFMFPLGLGWLKKNKPITYEPSRPPMHLLP